MSKKNRFQKSKSRKYRGHYQVRENIARPREVETLHCNVSTTEIKTKLKEQGQGEIVGAKDAETQDFASLHSSLRDLCLAMYLSAGFVIFLIALYIVKLKTPIFNLAVDYLYKMIGI